MLVSSGFPALEAWLKEHTVLILSAQVHLPIYRCWWQLVSFLVADIHTVVTLTNAGFFWDDFWPSPGGGFPDAMKGVAADTGLSDDLDEWGKITASYHMNMDALRNATLEAGKFAWQLMWTGGAETGVGDTCPHQIITRGGCADGLRRLCNETAPPQTRAMMYALNAHRPNVLPDVTQDLVCSRFLLTSAASVMFMV
jgi:hypothetical protein